MTQPLNALSLALCVISLTFFLVACIGYSDDETTAKNVPWAVYDDNNVEQWFGLRMYVAKAFGVQGSVEYSDCTSNDTCDKCNQDGKAAFGLMIIALTFTTICAGLSGAMIASANSAMQIANVLIAFVGFGTSLISVGLFMGGCYTEIQDSVGDEDKLTWGPGSILAIIGMLLMFMVTVFQIAANALGDGNLPPSANTATPVPAIDKY